jgi:hypothetical protein
MHPEKKNEKKWVDMKLSFPSNFFSQPQIDIENFLSLPLGDPIFILFFFKKTRKKFSLLFIYQIRKHDGGMSVKRFSVKRKEKIQVSSSTSHEKTTRKGQRRGVNGGHYHSPFFFFYLFINK